MPNPACGEHAELLSNAAFRVTRCSCGTVHLTLVAAGVTVRMSADMLRELASALPVAVNAMKPPPQVGTTGSRCVN